MATPGIEKQLDNMSPTCGTCFLKHPWLVCKDRSGIQKPCIHHSAQNTVKDFSCGICCKSFKKGQCEMYYVFYSVAQPGNPLNKKRENMSISCQKCLLKTIEKVEAYYL